MSTKKTIILAISITLVIASGIIVVGSLISNETVITETSMLDREANGMNKKLPLMLDTDTRLDKATAGPGNRFNYHYTLVNWTRQTADTTILKQKIRPRVIANYKAHPLMKDFRDNKVILNYLYKDKNGEHLFTISISPTDF